MRASRPKRYGPDDPVPVPAASRRREHALAALAMLMLVTTVAGAGRLLLEPGAEPPSARFDVLPHINSRPGSSLSPDGRRLAFVTGPGSLLLWVRPLDSPAAESMPDAAVGGALFGRQINTILLSWPAVARDSPTRDGR